MTATTVPIMLTGQSLVDYVNSYDLTSRSRTEMIMDAGYVYDNGKAMYTEFYTALLRAKGVAPVLDSDVEEELYDELSRDTKALYDKVDEMLGEKWDHEEVMEFLHELDDIGITTVDQFDDFYFGVYDTEEEFAEEFCNQVDSINTDSPYYFAIDWQRVWDHSLRYDFDTIEFDRSVFFFRNL